MRGFRCENPDILATVQRIVVASWSPEITMDPEPGAQAHAEVKRDVRQTYNGFRALGKRKVYPMRECHTKTTVLVTLIAIALTGCAKETQPTNTAGVQQQPYPQQPYPQQPVATQPTYQQQPAAAQPTAAQPAAAQPAAAQPAAAQPAAAAASPAPSPMATACKSDAECIGAKCNVAAGKCQFPCGSNNDCQAGWACNLQLGQVCMPAAQIGQ